MTCRPAADPIRPASFVRSRRAPWLALPGAALSALALCLVLLVSPPAARAEEAPLTPAQTKAVEKLIGDYLREHPEALTDALHKLAAQQKAAEEERQRLNIRARANELTRDPGAPVAGNPKGDVTVVEFFDYSCPYCRALAPKLQALIDEDKSLRFVFKEFPILSAISNVAAHAALAAEKQGKYADFHFALMDFHGSLSEQVVFRTAQTVGIDVARLKTDMAAPEIDEAIERNHKLAEALGVNGTPAFVIGETLVPGAADVSYLKDLIAKERAKEGSAGAKPGGAKPD